MAKAKGKPASTNKVWDKIVFLVAQQMQTDEASIRPETKLQEDLHCDSLDLVEIVMIVEEEFGLQISDEDAEKIVAVQDIETYVMKAA